MRLFLAIMIGWLVLLFFLHPLLAQAGDLEVIDSFASPLDDCRGLTSDGTFLYVADIVDDPPGSLRRLSKLDKDGNVLTDVEANSWCLTHQGSFFYSTLIHVHGYQRYDQNLEYIDNTELSGWNHSPRRVAWDGQYLWMTFPAAGESLLRKIDVGTQSTVATFALPFSPMAIAWDGSNLWISDLAGSQIHQVSTAAVVLQSIPSPGPSPQGLAWDGDGLWVCDDVTDTIYLLGEATATEKSSWSGLKSMFR